MINIDVYSNIFVEIENKAYSITSHQEMIIFLKDLLDKVYYGGERICLESVNQNIEEGKNYYTEIDRWGF